ncbi:19543_t:CDS:2, partial [Dentiscutata erythropus]
MELELKRDYQKLSNMGDARGTQSESEYPLSYVDRSDRYDAIPVAIKSKENHEEIA